MKILFVRPAFEGPLTTFLYPWLGGGYLSAYIKQNMGKSVEVKMADEVVGQDVISTTKTFNPDIVGITSTTLEFDRASYLAKAIRQETRSPIIFGGIHLTARPESMPRDFDIGVQGEGEAIFYELCKFYEAHGRFSDDFLSSLDGIYFHKNGRVVGRPGNRHVINNLDDIPMPDRSIISDRYYEPQHHFPGNYGRGTSIFTSRGCLFNCIYCGGGTFWPKPVRYHSSKRVVQEISTLVDVYNLKYINILDDLFHFSKPRLKEILELIRAAGIHQRVKFSCQASAALMDEETLDLLRQMGMVYLGFGLETGSDRILKIIKYKTASVKKHSEVLRWSRQKGFLTGSGFMIGNPGETKDDLKATYDFILKNSLNVCNVYHTIPFPGTRLWEIARAAGVVSDDVEWKRFNQFYEGENFISLAAVNRSELKNWKLRIAAACKLNMIVNERGVTKLIKGFLWLVKHPFTNIKVTIDKILASLMRK